MSESGLKLAEETITPSDVALVTFTSDGTKVLRGDGPFLRLSAYEDPEGESNIEVHRKRGSAPVTVQGHEGVIIVDQDSDPARLDLPESMKGLKNRWISVAWVDGDGRSVAVQGKGLSTELLIRIAEGVEYVR